MQEFEPVVTDLIVKHLRVDRGAILESSKFVEDLGADSLDVVGLVMAVEREFDIQIPDDDAEQLKSRQDILKFLSLKSRPS